MANFREFLEKNTIFNEHPVVSSLPSQGMKGRKGKGGKGNRREREGNVKVWSSNKVNNVSAAKLVLRNFFLD